MKIEVEAKDEDPKNIAFKQAWFEGETEDKKAFSVSVGIQRSTLTICTQEGNYTVDAMEIVQGIMETKRDQNEPDT